MRVLDSVHWLSYGNKVFLVYECVQVCGCRYLSGASSSSQVCYSLTEVSKRLRELVESAMQGQRVCKGFLGRSVGVGDMAIPKLLF